MDISDALLGTDRWLLLGFGTFDLAVGVTDILIRANMLALPSFLPTATTGHTTRVYQVSAGEMSEAPDCLDDGIAIGCQAHRRSLILPPQTTTVTLWTDCSSSQADSRPRNAPTRT